MQDVLTQFWQGIKYVEILFIKLQKPQSSLKSIVRLMPFLWNCIYRNLWEKTKQLIQDDFLT